MRLDPRTWFAAPSPPPITTRCESFLVTMEEFAAFIRREDGYFNPENWSDSVFRGAGGGDRILDLIEFRWDKRASPVRKVTWFEADAYCRWKKGVLRRAPKPPALTPAPRRWFRSRAALPAASPAHGEWCHDWCGRSDAGSQNPDVRSLKCVLNHEPPCVTPEFRGERIGFRVVWTTGAELRHGK